MANLPTAAVASRAVRGRLSVRFALDGRRTVLTRAERTPPLHIQRLLYLDAEHPTLARAMLLNTTAGLFAGDTVELTVSLETGTAVEVTTPTMTRVFAMQEGCAVSSVRIRAAAGSYLGYLPEPTLLCRGASLRQEIRLDGEAGASLAIGDVIAFGRLAAGERHLFCSLDQVNEFRYAGETVLADRLKLGLEQPRDVVGVLGAYGAFGSLQVLADEHTATMLLADTRSLLAQQDELLGGASLLHTRSGVAVRVLGDAPHAVHQMLRTVLDRFRTMCGPRT